MNVSKETICTVKDCFTKRQKANLLQILTHIFAQVCYAHLEGWKERKFTFRLWFHPWHLSLWPIKHCGTKETSGLQNHVLVSSNLFFSKMLILCIVASLSYKQNGSAQTFGYFYFILCQYLSAAVGDGVKKQLLRREKA